MLDLATHYKDYFKQAREMGLNSIRFSVEWALVEPQEGVFNQAELDRYADMAIEALKNDITPVICLHHYTDPCWFIDQGGFESEENIHYFVRFARRVYTTIIEKLNGHKEISEKLLTMHPILWATFNNPSGYAFRGYYTNDGPPSNPAKKGLLWVGTVIKNMMEAHVRVYQELNTAYKHSSVDTVLIKKPYIGFLKNMVILDPSHRTITHSLLSPLSQILSLTNLFLHSLEPVSLAFKYPLRCHWCTKTHRHRKH
jgi:beta-glucosidase